MEKDKVVAQGKAVYFKIDSYEMGPHNTGKRSANYHCWVSVYDSDGVEIIKHPLSDCFSGKWSKCSSVIYKWRNSMTKNNLIQKNNQWKQRIRWKVIN